MVDRDDGRELVMEEGERYRLEESQRGRESSEGEEALGGGTSRRHGRRPELAGGDGHGSAECTAGRKKREEEGECSSLLWLGHRGPIVYIYLF